MDNQIGNVDVFSPILEMICLGISFEKLPPRKKIKTYYTMKKGFMTVLLSVVAGGLTAYAVVKATQPEVTPATVVKDASGNAVEYRTVNLAETDYPDFTYAAESAVEAVVYVEVTVRQQYQLDDPFFRFFFGNEFGQPQSREQKGSGVDRILTQYYSWRSTESPQGAQVDLAIDRADGIINLCEVKYSGGTYAISKDEFLKLRNRSEAFRRETGTKKGLFITFITTYGLERNGYSDIANSQVTMADLFV